MHDDGNATTGEREDESSSGQPSRASTRRSLLASALAGSGLVAGPGLVLGQSTATPSGPPAPEPLETTLVTGGYGVGLTWEAPVDPCGAGVDHYVVTVDGSEATTVPAGITHASVDASLGDNVFGVRAVDETGATSSTTTVERDVSRYDRERAILASPTPDVVAEGDTTTIQLGVLDPPFRDHSSFLGEPLILEGTVSLSASCVATIVGATVSDVYSPTDEAVAPADSVSVADDGSSATVSLDVEPNPPVEPTGFVPIATLDVEGLNPGVVQTEVVLDRFETSGGYAIDATPVPDSLSVVTSGQVLDPLENVSVDQFGDELRVSWDLPANPCESNAGSYVVSVDGRQQATLPVGATRASAYVDRGHRVVEVRAVGPDGAASPSATERVRLRGGVADPGTVLELAPERNPIAPGQSVPVHLELTEVLTDLERAFTYELTLSLGASCVASLTDVSIPAESYVSDPESVDKISTTVADDGSTASIRGWFHPDIFSDSSAYRYRIGTVEVTGEHLAGVTLDVDVQSMVKEASGDSIPVLEEWTTLTVSEDPARPPSVGDNENRPRDPDVDGRFEDVNGNGEQELGDVVDFFQHRESDAVTGNVGAYDFSGNDEIDLGDAVQLFTENAG